jgi:hypothetical protein
VIQLPGVLIDYAKVSQTVGSVQQPFTTEDRPWRWEASPLALNTRALARALPDNVDYLLGRRQAPAVAAPAGEADRSFSQAVRLQSRHLVARSVLPARAVPDRRGGGALWVFRRRSASAEAG